MDVEEDNWICDESKDVLSGHNGTIWCLGFPNSSKLSKFMTSCGDDNTIFLWELNQNQSSWTLKQQFKTPHYRPIFHLDWSLPLSQKENSEDNCIMLSCSGDNNIIAYSLLDTKDGTSLEIKDEILGAHTSDINCVKWNPNPKFKNLFVSVSDDMCIKLWEYC